MKVKITKTILPAITGVLTVLVFLILYTIIFHKEGISHYNDIGINDLIGVSLTEIIAFAVYWTSNLLTLEWLGKDNV